MIEMYGEYRQADPEGDYAAQVAWEQLVDAAAEYRDAGRAGRYDEATRRALDGEAEWGEEAWGRAYEYVTDPEVEHVGEPGYVGGQQ